jgi:hypothetical protein
MEPKPRGITPDIAGLTSLSWLTSAAVEYQKITGSIYTETNFFRGNTSIEILDKILPDIPHKPNILLVGLGLTFEPVICCYEPFRIAAHLEGKGVDYTMTLVDVDESVVEDIQTRSKLYLSYHQFDKSLASNFETVWKKYLADTKQKGREIFELEEGLKFSSYLVEDNGRRITYKNYLKDGIAAADVSPQFRAKLRSGEIKLVQDDIAVADIRTVTPYDYVELTNVLYLMPHAGQQLALANVSNAMRNGGRLLLNDIGGYAGRPVFTSLGGWFNDEKMAQLGLFAEKIIASDNSSRTVLLKKVAEASIGTEICR